MRFLTLVLIFISTSIYAAKDETSKVEVFFKSYLQNLREKNFSKSKEMMTKDYLKKMGGDEGLKRLLEMQDGKKEAPKVKLFVQKGVDDIYMIEIKDIFTRHVDYLYKVRKVKDEFKVDGTILKEE